jgi:hypothetical protein
MSSKNSSTERSRIGKVSYWLVVCLLVSGCNRGGLNLAPVEGVVKQHGTPLEGAGVLFLPATGPFAMGTTDANGRFTLMTANQDGALVGEHRVIISKTQTTARQIPGERLPRYDTKYLIPQKYADPSTSGLTAKVVDDDNEFEFEVN